MAKDSGPWTLRSSNTSGQVNRSSFIFPVIGKADGSSACGETGPKSKVCAPIPGPATWVKPMPPRPEFQGSTAASAKAVATAASAAVPPSARMAMPASAASRAWRGDHAALAGRAGLGHLPVLRHMRGRGPGHGAFLPWGCGGSLAPAGLRRKTRRFAPRRLCA